MTTDDIGIVAIHVVKSSMTVTARLKRWILAVAKIDERLDDLKINQGVLLATQNQSRKSTRLQDYEFKVFSQWGEDGIIQYLTKAVSIPNRTFIEFGVESFVEANCRFLLMKDDWCGFVVDGSAANVLTIRNSYFYWRHQITAAHAFITTDNINDILKGSGFGDDVGLLSIDLDGNDYFILEAISVVRPRILICEYNAVFGPKRKISVPYDGDFVRSRKHFSNLYWGASLSAMTHLASLKGYSLVGTNRAGNNAFYVRDDLLNENVEVLSVDAAYSPSHFRESRDERGRLTYLAGEERLTAIKGLPVVNVETNAIEVL